MGGNRNLNKYGKAESAKQLGVVRGAGSRRGFSAKATFIRQAEQMDENRIVLYKRSKQLGHGYYIVEISSNNSHLFLAAFDVESPESLLIELPERRAQEILREFENNYDAMASAL